MDLCDEKHKRLDEKVDNIESRITTHGKEIDIIKMDIIAQKKRYYTSARCYKRFKTEYRCPNKRNRGIEVQTLRKV